MNIDELLKQAQHFSDTEEHEKAAKAYEQILDLDPNHQIALVNLGTIHVDHLPDLGKARTMLSRAIELYPDEGIAYFNLGVCEVRVGNHPRACELWESAIERGYEVGRAHYNCGNSKWTLADRAWADGRKTEANELGKKAGDHLKKAVKAIPEFPPALVALGSCYYKFGHFDEALKWYNRALRIAPSDVLAWKGKILVYMRKEDYDKIPKVLDEIRRWSGGLPVVERIMLRCEEYIKDLVAARQRGVSERTILKLQSSIADFANSLSEVAQGFQAAAKPTLSTIKIAEDKPGARGFRPWVPDKRPLSREDRERLLFIKSRIDKEGAVVGESDVMLRVFERIHQLNQIDSDCSLVLLGETGVGKTFIVPCIVSSSGRADKGWIRITAQLFASGDFTAIKGEVVGYAPDHGFREIPRQGKPGLLQHFKGGTIFIDELLDLPREMQALLLDVIDSLLVQQVGDKRKGYIPNVRVIFGTNRDPVVEVREGNLRHDLWDRVSRFTITIPPLRDRKEDVPFIARRVLGETTIHTRILLALMLHDWRAGNVRELIDTLKKLPKEMNEKVDLACLELPEEITRRVNGIDTQEVGVALTRLIVDLLKKRGFERGKGLIKEMAKLLGVSEAKASGLLKQAGI